MKNAIKVLGVISMALIIGFAMLACDEDGGGDDKHTHQWGDWTQTTAATCTEAGEETRTCKLDATHTETRPVAALGHDYEWVLTTPPTIVAAGEEKGTCSRDSSHTTTRAITAVTFTTITDMGTWLAAQDGNRIDTAYAVKLSVGDLGGNSSTDGSAGKTLKDNDTKYVSLDLSGITDIGSSAFNGCISLTGVTIPAGVTNIGGWAFSGCYRLTETTIPAGVAIGMSAFNYCIILTSVTFQGTIPSIGDNAFLGDLRDKFYATDTTNGTPGTYTTTDYPVNSSSVWTKN